VNVYVTSVYGKELKLEFEEDESCEGFEENEPLVQLTLRIPESVDISLRELGVQLDPPTNRQGAINYILFLYYQKAFADASSMK
jgi:hypothetical protein